MRRVDSSDDSRTGFDENLKLADLDNSIKTNDPCGLIVYLYQDRICLPLSRMWVRARKTL